MTVGPESLESLSAEQRELLQLLLEQESEDLASVPVLPRPANLGAVPASAAQRRFWLLDRLARERGLQDPSINVNVWHVRGWLDAEALSRALVELVRRHEALRTRLYADGGALLQAPAEAGAAVLEVAAPQTGDAREVARALAAHEARRSFDLAAGSLLRARLLPLGTDEHLLLLATHYVAADGLAEGLLLAELGSLYRAFAAGEEPTAPANTLQYADFALWHQRWIGSVREDQVAYWKDQLRGSPADLRLPLDRSRPAQPSFAGSIATFELGGELSASLRAVARGQRVTLYMLLLAALHGLLHRYSEQADVVVGTIVSDRPRPEAERMLGSFSNNVLLRASAEPGMAFSELLKAVRTTAARSYAKQSLPFEDLVAELLADPDFAGVPVPRVMFVLHYHSLDSDLQLGESLELARVPIDRGSSTFDLYIRMADSGEDLSGSIEYSSDVFDASTVEQIIADFRNVLDALAGDPEQPLSALPVSLRASDAGKPAPAVSRRSTPSEAAGSAAEQAVAAAVADVLGVPAGLDDNLLDLGADSRQLLLLERRLSGVLGRAVPLALLLERPTLRALVSGS